MKTEELETFFTHYAAGFLTGNADTDRNLELKQIHTFRVLDDAREIMEREKFSPEETDAGEKAALLHDLSRFEQFVRFRTFRDAESFDHGARSAELVLEHHLLDGGAASEAILFAIRRHNQLLVGDAPSDFAEKIARLVRDADKIDIFRVLFAYFENVDNPSVTFSLDSRKTIAPEVLAAVREKRPVDHAVMHSVADFVAAKISWAYELHFAASRAIALERDLFGELGKFFADMPEIKEPLAEARAFLAKENGTE